MKLVVFFAMPESLCIKCEKDIVDDDFVECDCCDNIFHLACIKVSKTEKKARKNSKCLKLFCPECMENKNNGTVERIKDMSMMLFKLDLAFQQRKEKDAEQNDFLKRMEGKLNNIDDKMSKINNNNSPVGGNNRIVHSYANAVKRGPIKPAVVVKPKTQQSCAQTLDDITKNVHKADVQVCDTRNARDGGVVLRCTNSNETMKVKQIVHEKLGDGYEIVLPKVKSPRLRITNINEEISKDDVLRELKRHNSILENIEMKLITLIPRRAQNNYTYNDAVVEVNGFASQKLLKIGKLNLPWCECLVLEHVHVSRCFKCCGFFHKSTECKHSQICSHCGGSHKHSECKNKSKVCCVNCKNANGKFNANFNTKHNAWSKECPIYKRRLNSLVNKIEYNESE